MRFVSKLLLAFAMFHVSFSVHAEDNPVVEAMTDYMDFASYGDGTITKQQIESIGMKQMHFIDARKAELYDQSHIDGAVNIEWRQILLDLEAIPTEKTVVLYCDSGLLSSKAHFALRLAGFENVRVLLGGYAAWQK